jgi:hypothetical protein
VCLRDYEQDFYDGVNLGAPHFEQGTRKIVDLHGNKISALPSTLDAACDVEICARRALKDYPKHLLLFTACFVHGRLKETDIPAQHLKLIKKLCGQEFVRCGLVSWDVYYSRTFSLNAELTKNLERKERVEAAALNRLSKRERVRKLKKKGPR